MTHESHLTEDERHGLADGSLEPEQRAAADAHLHACAECSADVNRIRSLMKRIDESKSGEDAAPGGIDELWPSIRARIEREKVVSIPAGSAAVSSAGGGSAGVRPRALMIGGVLAAGLFGLWAVRGRVAPVESPDIARVPDSGISLIAVVDSTHAYQEEAQALLNHLELERATLRPELARALDRDLRTIDVAIAELQEAIRTDPANPALRRLLASSFRQKVDLLKRVSNAG
jgi:anti-sigma factor RsiW